MKGYESGQEFPTSKDKFLEYAKNETKILPSSEFYSWTMENMGSAILGATARFKVIQDKDTGAPIGFKAAVNEGMFQMDGVDYSDLIPFVIEHEVQEAWMKIEDQPTTLNERHKEARRLEFSAALKDGKAEKLMEWLMKLNPNFEFEFKEAYTSALNSQSS